MFKAEEVIEKTIPKRSAQAAREVVRDTQLRQARTCYDHLAGVAGVELLEEMLSRRWVEEQQGQYRLTLQGTEALSNRGVDISNARSSKRKFAYGCLDWTERKHHVGGALGAAILHALEDAGQLRRQEKGRAVTLARHLAAWLKGDDNICLPQ